IICIFFFSSRRRHTRSKRDWSSDVCSSDLLAGQLEKVEAPDKTTIYTYDEVGNRNSMDEYFESEQSFETSDSIDSEAEGMVQYKIGRASCRERVEREVDRGDRKKKRERRMK